MHQQIALLPYPILNNASNKNAQTNGPPVKKIQNVFLPFKIAKRNAVAKLHAGNSVFQAKEAKPLLMLQNVLKQIIAFDPNR